VAGLFPSEATDDPGEDGADADRTGGLERLARIGAGIAAIVVRGLASLVGATRSLGRDARRDDDGSSYGDGGEGPRLPLDATGAKPRLDGRDGSVRRSGRDLTSSGSDTTKPMTDTPRRGTCVRCGLEFDAERGYTALDVLERAAEDPRSDSTERTIRLCDVCSEDFRDFVELGRDDTRSTAPEFLRSR